jgi:hypothetical protein
VLANLIWIGEGPQDLAILKSSEQIVHGFLSPSAQITKGSTVFACGYKENELLTDEGTVSFFYKSI